MDTILLVVESIFYLLTINVYIACLIVTYCSLIFHQAISQSKFISCRFDSIMSYNEQKLVNFQMVDHSTIGRCTPLGQGSTIINTL
jgi:hypothetical protein